MSWTAAEDRQLIKLASYNKFFWTEIAEKLGKKPSTVSLRARKLGLESTRKTCRRRFGKWRSKHSHLRRQVLTYFLDHTWDETKKRFRLTESELKSIFTAAYRDPCLRHLRKDTRNHSPWSAKELKFLLTHAGLTPRDWIAKKLKRGNAVCVKERMQTLGVSSRTLQGITLSQYIKAFGQRPDFVIETKAGPGRSGLPTYFKIVPWVYLNEQLKMKNIKAPTVFLKLVESMALFQNWIYEGNAFNKMQKIARKRIDHHEKSAG